MAPLTTNRFSFSAIATLQIVLLIIFYTFKDAQADGKRIHQGFCPPQIRGNLSDGTRNASGLFADKKSRGLIPTNTTRVEDAARLGCVWGSKPRLPICTSRRKADIGMTYVINEYANYSAIPELRNVDGTIDDNATVAGPQNWFDVFVWSPCPDNPMFDLDPKNHDTDEYYLLSNGSLFLRYDQTLLGFEDYCLRIGPGRHVPTAAICSPETKLYVLRTDGAKIQHIGSLVSVPFIVVTVFVYSVLPELRNIHGTTLRSYLCCLAVTSIALGIARLPESEYQASKWCLFLGFFSYFASIAHFSWLNVISFDLWRRIGRMGSTGNRNFDTDRKKFFWYSIYVGGVSLVMTATCIGLEFSPGVSKSFIRPGFEKNACWFSEAAIPYYYFGPTGLSTCCNIGFFISTTIRLFQHNKIMRRDFNTGESGRHNHNKQWFGLYLKLFIVTGVCWITESLSSFCGGPHILWLVVNTVNALQGVLIFYVFVCKKSIWLSLKKRYGRKKMLPGTNHHRLFDCIRTPPNIEDSQEIRDLPSQSFSSGSQVTQEDTL